MKTITLLVLAILLAAPLSAAEWTGYLMDTMCAANLLDKARQQPDKVKMVLEKIRTDGLGPTIETVRNKLDQPIPLGYCNVGSVLEVGAGVSGFKADDRVASNGQHASVIHHGCGPASLLSATYWQI